jgi:hypothetical protein
MIDSAPPPQIDTSVPQSARIWNYWLGGKDNYPVDRAAGDQIAGFFEGLELVEPGVVWCPRWRPDAADGLPAEIDAFGGVGRKP